MLERLLNETEGKFQTVLDVQSRTHFHLACQRGDLEVVNILLKYHDKTDIDLNDTDFHKMTGFLIACRENHQNVVQKILQESMKKNIDLNATDINKQNGFHLACAYGHDQLVKLLLTQLNALDKIFNFNALDNDQKTAFHLACSHQNHKIVEIFLQESFKHKINLNAIDNKGQSGFHHACITGDDTLVRVLINGSVKNMDLYLDINIKDFDGMTGHDHARKLKHKKVLKTFKELGKSSGTSNSMMSRLAGFVGFGDDSSEAQNLSRKERQKRINADIEFG